MEVEQDSDKYERRQEQLHGQHGGSDDGKQTQLKIYQWICQKSTRPEKRRER